MKTVICCFAPIETMLLTAYCIFYSNKKRKMNVFPMCKWEQFKFNNGFTSRIV